MNENDSPLGHVVQQSNNKKVQTKPSKQKTIFKKKNYNLQHKQ